MIFESPSIAYVVRTLRHLLGRRVRVSRSHTIRSVDSSTASSLGTLAVMTCLVGTLAGGNGMFDVCLATSPPATVAVVDDPQPLLPDLFPWASESRGYLHDWVVEGDLLRFTTAFANSGVGHLELRGGDILDNGNQQVFQRIFYDDGTFEDRLAGEFTYHSGHGHIHFDGYAIYKLREHLDGGGIGDVVATGGKISFCLIDITKYHSNAGASRYNSCGQIQGVTAGWSDVYTRSLPDQWINISLVPDGLYWLEVIIDPDNLLLESNTENNIGRVLVEINRGGPTGGGDRWEVNNSFAQATPFGKTSEFHEVGLSIHNPSDEDYFQIISPLHGEWDVHVNFSHELGDLDLFVYDHQQNLIASSTSDTDNEEVHFHGHEDHKYFIVIRGVDGGTNGYEIEAHGPGDLITQIDCSSDVPVQIPDGNGGSSPGPWIESELFGPEIEISDLNLIFERLDHTWLGDLEIELVSPQGTTAKILTSQWQSGGGLLGGDDNFRNTRIDDSAALSLEDGEAPYVGWFNTASNNTGQNPLSVFNGENAYGVWRLRIRDWYTADTGTLHAWCLMFTGVNLNPGDRFEPNNSHPQAVDLGTLGQATVEDVSIHNETDQDYYRFLAGVSGYADLSIEFEHSVGNLDMIVYDSSLQEVGRSDSADDNELLKLWVDADELYYVQVFGVQGARNDYRLEVDVAPQIGETGTLSNIDHNWTIVEFSRPYERPIVIAGPPSHEDPQPGPVLIRNVTSTGFEIKMGDWEFDSGQRAGEVVDYLVIEAGRHELPNGLLIEAGALSSVGGRAVGQRLAFPRGTSTIVLPQVTSDRLGRAGLARIVKSSGTGFNVIVQEPEGFKKTTAQSVHWVAVSVTNDVSNAFKLNAGLQSVSSVPSTVNFRSNFSDIPRLFAAPQTLHESDPSGLRLLDLKSAKGVLRLQEEQTRDNETDHIAESVGWMATSGGKIFATGRRR